MEIKSKTAVFGGQLIRFSHLSAQTGTTMTCAVFLPDPVATVPYLLYLSGLTCTDENVCQKSGIFRSLAQNKVTIVLCRVVHVNGFQRLLQFALHQIGFVAPDTSPRGAGIEGEDEDWDFGTGAGFYLDATAPKWSSNYRMYSYVTEELPALLTQHYPQLDHSR